MFVDPDWVELVSVDVVFIDPELLEFVAPDVMFDDPDILVLDAVDVEFEDPELFYTVEFYVIYSISASIKFISSYIVLMLLILSIYINSFKL